MLMGGELLKSEIVRRMKEYDDDMWASGDSVNRFESMCSSMLGTSMSYGNDEMIEDFNYLCNELEKVPAWDITAELMH